MSALIAIILNHLQSDDAPLVADENGDPLGDIELLELAQSIAEAIIAAGWPRIAARS